MAPVALALAVLVGYQIVARFVPMTWASILPGGLEKARFFRGWPGLIWALSVQSHRNLPGTAGTLAAIVAIGFGLSLFARPLRPVVWLVALAAVLADAGIVYVTLRVAVEATAREAGLS